MTWVNWLKIFFYFFFEIERVDDSMGWCEWWMEKQPGRRKLPGGFDWENEQKLKHWGWYEWHWRERAPSVCFGCFINRLFYYLLLCLCPMDSNFLLSFCVWTVAILTWNFHQRQVLLSFSLAEIHLLRFTRPFNRKRHELNERMTFNYVW